jgi:hypothetical protein
LFVILFSVGSTPVSAHTSVNAENIKIDVGWKIELLSCALGMILSKNNNDEKISQMNDGI